VFPYQVDSPDLRNPVIVTVVHRLFAQYWGGRGIDWRSYNPTTDELIPLSRTLAQAAMLERDRKTLRETPLWLIRFAFRFLTQEPLPPTSVIVDCLTIVAINLGCSLLLINSRVTDEESTP
jgi:hypothetical protein